MEQYPYQYPYANFDDFRDEDERFFFLGPFAGGLLGGFLGGAIAPGLYGGFGGGYGPGPYYYNRPPYYGGYYGRPPYGGFW
ncbi:hypothetical protein [Halobacillus mangrovi]|uniref:Uncharacterized protein n=1 Tax=Halobacillus mangrovi TaxID=402384 RepID=A0A1W5ZXY3_9BACI|nr:hypothetical protein [Halobacillus mangrovi]ARI78215.1 hypothetical protein HM131_15755 [Halobacillus mangrovi]